MIFQVTLEICRFTVRNVNASTRLRQASWLKEEPPTTRGRPGFCKTAKPADLFGPPALLLFSKSWVVLAYCLLPTAYLRQRFDDELEAEGAAYHHS